MERCRPARRRPVWGAESAWGRAGVYIPGATHVSARANLAAADPRGPGYSIAQLGALKAPPPNGHGH
ncbi:hypothetical protein MRX96_016573 [Rhipicephalus microplus]